MHRHNKNKNKIDHIPVRHYITVRQAHWQQNQCSTYNGCQQRLTNDAPIRGFLQASVILPNTNIVLWPCSVWACWEEWRSQHHWQQPDLQSNGLTA